MVSVAGYRFLEFIENFNLKNNVSQPTRVASYKSKTTGEIRISSTLIDVLISNNDNISQCCSISCPFSDHNFVTAALDVKSTYKFIKEEVCCRNLSEKNLELISNVLRETDFSFIFSLPDAISKWVAFKDTLDKVINLVAPKKKIKIKDKENIFPWNDLELSILKNQRNRFYAHYIKTKSEVSYNSYHPIWIFKLVSKSLKESK